MSGIDWFPIRFDNGYMEPLGQSNGSMQSQVRLKVIASKGDLVAVKRPGTHHQSLIHRLYDPAQFEIWQLKEGKGMKILAFPVRS